MLKQLNIALLRYKKFIPLIFIFIPLFLVPLSQPEISKNIWQYSFDDGTYSHAFLVPFISLYLYWILFKEDRLILNQQVNYIILLITILLGIIIILSSVSKLPIGYRFAFPLFITSLTALIFKPQFKVIFPSLFLIFLIPIWGILTPYLQELSTIAVTYMMSHSGIPIYVEGNFISIPSGVFEIADGCSGLRYLIVSLAISSLFIFLNINNSSQAFLFMTIAVLGALITNWLRITFLIMIGHYTDMESSLMDDHNSFGWYLYIPFMILLFYFGQRFIKPTANEVVQQKDMTSSLPKPTIYALIIILCFSSVTFSFFSNIFIKTHAKNSNCTLLSEHLPLPKLYNVSTFCESLSPSEINITYNFKLNELESSPHFYLNEYKQNNWVIQKEKEINNWNFLLISKNNQFFILQYQFSLGNIKTSNLSLLKKFALIGTLTGNFSSSLQWNIVQCDKNCLSVFNEISI